MKPKDIANTGMAIALLFVTGYVVYMVTKPLVLPGAKFLFMAPLLSFIQYFPLKASAKASTIVLLNVGFAILLALMSPLMSVAILLSGLMAAVVFACVLKLTNTEQAIHWSMSSYPMWAMLISFYISIEITKLNIYGSQWNVLVGVVAIACFALGRIGTYFSERLIHRTNPKRRKTNDF